MSSRESNETVPSLFNEYYIELTLFLIQVMCIGKTLGFVNIVKN